MKPILTILEPEHFSEAALERLAEYFTVFKHSGVSNCDVLWTRFAHLSLERYPVVSMVVSNCTDVSHLPAEECKRRGIEVLSLKGIEGLENVHATAEHTISLMLQALRHRCDRSGGRIGRELYDKRVGILGLGRIGRQVGRALSSGFGCWVNALDLTWQLSQCDIVSIHASLNETSRGMVNTEFLSKLKPGCILVNTARDAIVQREAIYAWLGRDEQAIYAHDFADEWDKPGTVRLADIRGQIISTPHIGGWTIESLHKTEELLAEKVIEWAKARTEVSV